MNHQRLKCYNRLLEAAKNIPTLTKRLPRGTSYLRDQLERALASAILNLCEGNARRSPKERMRFFDISLASIAEASSAIDIMQAFGYISRNDKIDIQSSLSVSYAMIINLRKHQSQI